MTAISKNAASPSYHRQNYEKYSIPPNILTQKSLATHNARDLFLIINELHVQRAAFAEVRKMF